MLDHSLHFRCQHLQRLFRPVHLNLNVTQNYKWKPRIKVRDEDQSPGGAEERRAGRGGEADFDIRGRRL